MQVIDQVGQLGLVQGARRLRSGSPALFLLSSSLWWAHYRVIWLVFFDLSADTFQFLLVLLGSLDVLDPIFSLFEVRLRSSTVSHLAGRLAKRLL